MSESNEYGDDDDDDTSDCCDGDIADIHFVSNLFSRESGGCGPSRNSVTCAVGLRTITKFLRASIMRPIEMFPE